MVWDTKLETEINPLVLIFTSRQTYKWRLFFINWHENRQIVILFPLSAIYNINQCVVCYLILLSVSEKYTLHYWRSCCLCLILVSMSAIYYLNQCVVYIRLSVSAIQFLTNVLCVVFFYCLSLQCTLLTNLLYVV